MAWLVLFLNTLLPVSSKSCAFFLCLVAGERKTGKGSNMVLLWLWKTKLLLGSGFQVLWGLPLCEEIWIIMDEVFFLDCCQISSLFMLVILKLLYELCFCVYLCFTMAMLINMSMASPGVMIIGHYL